MKILITADTYFPHVNGASYFAQRLAETLKKRGHEVLVIAPSQYYRQTYYEHNGVNIFGVRSVPLIGYHGFSFSPPVFIKRTLRNVIKKFKPDIVHVQSHFFVCKTVTGLAHELGIPVVGTNHFMPENLAHYLHLPDRIESRAIEWSWQRFRLIFEKLDLVTTPTETAAQLMRKIGFSKDIVPVSCGIDLNKFNPRFKDLSIKNRYHIPDVPMLLYVGRLDKEKRLDFVLKTLPAVLQKTPIHFVIIGRGAEASKLKALTKDLGIEKNVTFTDFIPNEDLPVFYASADCFIIAGIAELQSIVTMEAMASGLPVIGVNAVALPELVHDNDNGLMYEEDDANGLTACLVKMFSDAELRQRMGQKSLDIIQRHDINKTMEKFESLYDGVLAGQAQPSTEVVLPDES